MAVTKKEKNGWAEIEFAIDLCGMNFSDLAKAIGVSPRTVYRWAQKRQAPELAGRLAMIVLGADPNYGPIQKSSDG